VEIQLGHHNEIILKTCYGKQHNSPAPPDERLFGPAIGRDGQRWDGRIVGSGDSGPPSSWTNRRRTAETATLRRAAIGRLRRNQRLDGQLVKIMSRHRAVEVADQHAPNFASLLPSLHRRPHDLFQANNITTERASARYVSAANGGAVSHATMSLGASSAVSIQRRHVPRSSLGSSTLSGSQKALRIR
jgi:hypothetical protein